MAGRGRLAQYKGVGTINGAGSYKFLLTAVDGDLIARGKADRFRIKIWHADGKGNDMVDYDNLISTSGVGTDPEGTILGGAVSSSASDATPANPPPTPQIPPPASAWPAGSPAPRRSPALPARTKRPGLRRPRR
jgi:hypothetical protein